MLSLNDNFMIRMDQNLRDLNPIVAGEGHYTSEDPQFPQSWEFHLLHYVRCGKGTLRLDGKTYSVKAGQIMLFQPGETAYFMPEKGSVWGLRWVGFNGALAHRFAELPPVFDAPKGTFLSLCDIKNPNCALEYKLASELLFLHAMLLQPQRKKITTDYVQWIMDAVQQSYMNPLSVADIAAQLGLDSCYLSRKFKKSTNMTIQSYIIQTRLNCARRYLENGYSVKEAASMCGFTDASAFCKTFKKFDPDNRSPLQWQQFILNFRKQSGSARSL